MRILLISQVFWPDSVAAAQHLTDLAIALSKRKHDVTIVASRYAYDNPSISFKPREYYKNIRILRLKQTHFSKESVFGRLVNYFTYNLSFFMYLLLVNRKRFDGIIGTTAPPLSSFLGIFIARIKRIPFCFWAMDLQPELSIVAGYLGKRSMTTKLLEAISGYILKKSDLIIALDAYMADHIRKKGGNEGAIRIHPVWPVMSEIYTGKRMDNPFRKTNGFGDRLVVMYSGNHAVVHPLDTLLEAARMLRDEKRFLFVFIGGGVRKQDVLRFKEENDLDTIVNLPYQDRAAIHLSLGSADIHVVIHGNGCTGYTHPSKIYGAMFIGKPVAYIGPPQSHIADILEGIQGNIAVRHGQADILAGELRAFLKKGEAWWRKTGKRNRDYALQHMVAEKCINDIIDDIEKMTSCRT